MFSTVTSALFSISLTMSSPFGDFRLIASDFLLTLNWWKYHGSSSGLPGRSRRPGSPRPGFSILTTSAPNQASTSVEVVPASNWVKSTTLTPWRKLRSWVLSLIADSHSLRADAGTQPAPSRATTQCLPDRFGGWARRVDAAAHSAGARSLAAPHRLVNGMVAESFTRLRRPEPRATADG